MTDDDLSRRFAALKSSSQSSTGSSRVSSPSQHIVAAQARAQQEQDDLERIADGRPLDPDSQWGSAREDQRGVRREEDEVAKRHLALKGGIEEDWAVGDDEDEDIEAFIASLSASSVPSTQGQQITSATKRESDVDLAREAAALIRQTRLVIDSEETPRWSEVGKDKKDLVEATVVEDEETEQEILERALEEAELEAANRKAVRGTAAADDAKDDESSFDFPSLPSHPPAALDVDDQDETEAEARMALLLGLSGPSTKPGGPSLPAVPTVKPAQGKQPGQGWDLPGWHDGRDDDLDSWCCICNKDATVQCAGCDDDVYCDECWRDGHGPGGEQGHRARRLTWGKKAGLVG